ncbi:MAG TPA: hypothetical protein DDZ51_09470 [Planctomycetaceae bacterium]|nr:hypothetical protein [Planctomycetaceae bacterium]
MNAALQNDDSTTDGDGAALARVIEEMQFEAKEIAKRWVSDECRLGEEELKVRYKWAQDLKLVREQEKEYGAEAYKKLKEILKHMGQDHTVYDRIADHIDSGMYKKVVNFNKSKTARDFRITWSHLGILSRLSDDGLRREQLTHCMDGKLSVRQLSALASEATKSDPAGTTVKRREGGVKSTVMRLAKQTEKLSGQAGKLEASLSTERLTDLRRNEIDEAIEACKMASKSASACIEAMSSAIRMYTSAIQDLQSRQIHLDNYGCEIAEESVDSLLDPSEQMADADSVDSGFDDLAVNGEEAVEDEEFEYRDSSEEGIAPETQPKPPVVKQGAPKPSVTTNSAVAKSRAKAPQSSVSSSEPAKQQLATVSHQPQDKRPVTKPPAGQAQQSERPQPGKSSPARKPAPGSAPGSTAQKKGGTSPKKLVWKQSLKAVAANGPSASTTEVGNG